MDRDFEDIKRQAEQSDNSRNLTARHLPFSQRLGYVALPGPMQLEHLSGDLRNAIWSVIYELLDEKAGRNYFARTGALFVRRVLAKHKNQPADEFPTERVRVQNEFKAVVLNGSFNRVLDLVEIIANDRDIATDFAQEIEVLFDEHAAGYWLDTAQHPFRFFPRSSQEQGEATRRDIEKIQDASMDGAVTHLRQAADHINAQQYPDSVADSIGAIESVARKITNSGTLGDALKALVNQNLLTNPQLKKALEKLYTYTNAEEGVRHALVFQESSSVELDEAMFMYSACAAFAAYLARKQQILEKEQGNQAVTARSPAE